MLSLLAAAAWALPPSPPGKYLPRTSLFDLTRQSDCVALVQPQRGDVVRVLRIVGRKGGPKRLRVAHFGDLWQALSQPATKQYPAQSHKDYNRAVLFLRRGDSAQNEWWICQTIPRAAVARGCVWVRDGRCLWYHRNPWSDGPRLLERDPPNARPGRAYLEKMTVEELLEAAERWQRDLTRLRTIDALTTPMAQVRALRAFVHPSTRPPHSPESIDLVKQVYREVGRHIQARWDGKTTEPASPSPWDLIRGGPPPSVAKALKDLESKDPKERTSAIDHLHAMAARQVKPAALKALEDPEGEVRVAAATALADFADAACSATLIARYRNIKDPSDPVRPPLTVALATSGDPAAIAELIRALQDFTDSVHYRQSVRDFLFWRFGLTPRDTRQPEYLWALWWARRFERRYDRSVELEPWDYARLEELIKRSPSLFRRLPGGELRLIPAATVEEILRRCAQPAFPHRAQWCELLFRAWNAGALSDDHKRAVLETFGAVTSLIRDVYPMGTTARIPVSSGWPRPVSLPETMRVTLKSQLYVDGSPTGRPYPMRALRVYVRPVSPGDFGPGKHRYYVETEYAIRVRKSTFTHTVRSQPQTFAVVMPGEPIGLQAVTDPQLDARVEEALAFVVDGGTTPTNMPAPNPRPARYPAPDGGSLEIRGENGWKLTAPVPVDLAFDVEYELLDFGLVFNGSPLFIPEGQTPGAWFQPHHFRSRVAALQEPGIYRFRVRLAPSRDVALAHRTADSFWDGYMLESPEMTFRVVKIPPKKSEKR